MPLVRVTARYNANEELEAIGHALYEIVPAAMNSSQGPLTPGSICYMSSLTDTDLLTVDVFIEVESYHYEDRLANLDERAAQIRHAMEQCFGHYTFAVWPKLVTAGWSREAEDPEFDGDMSIEAALERAWSRLGRTDR